MYSEEQYYKALEVYEETKSVTKTITILGYPARRQTLYNWINRKRILPEGKSTFRGYNTEDHPRHPPLEQKLQILHRCFEMGEDVQSVSNEVGYSTASIYTWRRKYIQKGAAALMNPSNERSRGKLTAGEPAPSRELDELKAKVQDMQLETNLSRVFFTKTTYETTKRVTRMFHLQSAIYRGQKRSSFCLEPGVPLVGLCHGPDGAEAHAGRAHTLAGEKFPVLLPRLPVKAVVHGDGQDAVLQGAV